MIFSELYGAYYNVCAKIIAKAVVSPVTMKEIREIISENAFGESLINIEPALKDERWQVIYKDGSTPIKHIPSMPYTSLERRWLKSISLDPRIKLFGVDLSEFENEEPLFTPEDFCVFDRYSDGDDYGNEEYIKFFRLVMDAIKNGSLLSVKMINSKYRQSEVVFVPEYMEYSEKDDKFRARGSYNGIGTTVNIGRIISCTAVDEPVPEVAIGKKRNKKNTVMKTLMFELIDRRNALERVMLHFAHFEKEAERIGEDRYRVTLKYDKDDETELVIRVLSFGPMIKVTGPDGFVRLIRERLSRQKNLCEHTDD